MLRCLPPAVSARQGRTLLHFGSSFTSDPCGHPVSIRGMGRHNPDLCCWLPVFFITCCQRSKIHPPESGPLNSRVPKSVAFGDCENWFLDPTQSFWFLRAKVGLEDKHFYCKFPDATTNYWWWWETIWEHSLGSAFSGRESSSLPTFKGCLGPRRKSGLYPASVLPYRGSKGPRQLAVVTWLINSVRPYAKNKVKAETSLYLIFLLWFGFCFVLFKNFSV